MRDLHLPGRSPVYATHAMAATSMPAATLTALDVLRAGGNAMDAAVAAVAVLGVIEPQSTGIGGDCFCLWKQPGQPVVALNGSGRAPGAATIDWFEAQGITAIDDTGAALRHDPRRGRRVGDAAGGAWHARGWTSCCSRRSGSRRRAGRCTTASPRTGRWRPPSCARTARTPSCPVAARPSPATCSASRPWPRRCATIAREGARGFYEGAVAADMVATLRARGGLHTEADFAAGRTAAQFVQPIHTAWRGYEVWQCPPNGSGLMVLMLLGILDGFDAGVRPARARTAAPPRRGGAAGIPRPRRVPGRPGAVRRAGGALIDPAYLAGLRALIDPARALPDLPRAGEAMLPPHRDTVYLCVVDRDGNACSFINSLFKSFGSGILAERSGVMLQNRGAGFVVQRGHPNCIAPNKRPMHTIIPGMLTKDGEAVMPFGVMGGHFQPMGQTLVPANLLEYGLDIQQALDLPRLFPYGGKLEVERGVPGDGATRWQRMGHAPARSSGRMAAGRRSGSTARAARWWAGRTRARTAWRWATEHGGTPC